MSTWPLTVSDGPSPSSGKKLCRTQLLPIPVMTPECFRATEAITSFTFLVSQMTCIVYIYGSCYNGTKSLIKQNHYRQEKTFKCTPKCKMREGPSRSLEELTQPSPAHPNISRLTGPSTAVFCRTEMQHSSLPGARAIFCKLQRDSHGHPNSHFFVKTDSCWDKNLSIYICSNIQW